MTFLRWNWTAGALWTPIGMSYWRSFLRTPRSTFAMREYWTKCRHPIVTRGWRGLYGMKWIWKDVHNLYEKGVDNLLNWLVAAAEVKANVHGVTKRFLDAAAEEARNPKKSSAPIYLEGCYESVYNARWHRVVEVPGGEGTGMEVGRGNHRSHGRTGRLATLSKRMTVCSNPVHCVSG
ncbi:putative retrotransposon hot spot protein (RHS) [Trypanosoma cruzi]|uniref:Putative retrotransposon hot spot protein (RHS) n=1 Tax=Trypanosoma cruzi TaxID=5693 RepID=A0A2V2W7E3_TRYCR|nr:putative retrotransposon hot spot protein (RHS) [Trypanosoma cruzi]